MRAKIKCATWRTLTQSLRLASFFLGTALSVDAQPIVYSDDFNSGTLDSSFWRTGAGNGISQSNGVLNIARNSPSDYLVSRVAFRGPFEISFDMMMLGMTFRDTFHGIALLESAEPLTIPGGASDGVGFGFTPFGINGPSFFAGQFTGGGQGFRYGPAFLHGAWYHFQMIGNEDTVEVFINDTHMFTSTFGHVDSFYVHIPGLYQDGGGPGPTVSRLDNFSLHIPPVPEPSVLSMILLGFLGAVAKVGTAAWKGKTGGKKSRPTGELT